MKNKLFITLLPFETERLIIRPTTIDDVDLLLKMDKQEKTQQFLGGIKNKTKEERISFIEQNTNKFAKGIVGSMTVCLKDGTPIGLTGLSIDEENNNAKINYIYDYDYCNKGYCTEACQKLISIGFYDLKLNKIYADIIDGNLSSIKVIEKLGFKHEGTRREAVYIKETGEYKDFLDYGLLGNEYTEK